MPELKKSDTLIGTWTYRSLINNPDLKIDFNSLEFGRANLEILTSETGMLPGRIYDTGWELTLKGSIQRGCPTTIWFQGTGNVDGSRWIYDYLCCVVPYIPNGINQIGALVGSVTRTIAHPDSQGGISPAGMVCSFYAVTQSNNWI